MLLFHEYASKQCYVIAVYPNIRKFLDELGSRQLEKAEEEPGLIFVHPGIKNGFV